MAAATCHVNVSDAASAINQQQLLMQQQQQQLLQSHRAAGNDDDDPGTASSKAIPPEGLDCYGNERQMLQDQLKFFNNPLLSDVTLKIGDQAYFAHKFVLIRSSDVFERMFSADWQDHNKKVNFSAQKNPRTIFSFQCSKLPTPGSHKNNTKIISRS